MGNKTVVTSPDKQPALQSKIYWEGLPEVPVGTIKSSNSEFDQAQHSFGEELKGTK